jgi:hypothetical protein
MKKLTDFYFNLFITYLIICIYYKKKPIKLLNNIKKINESEFN